MPRTSRLAAAALAGLAACLGSLGRLESTAAPARQPAAAAARPPNLRATGVSPAPHEGRAGDSVAVEPNIVLILTDDLGYGDLGCYGHPTIRTPRLDRLAAEGARFTSYYSGAPACTPARAALLTGRYAVRVGVPAVLGPEATHGLSASDPTLAERLRGRGYRTHAVGKWHLGHASADMLPTGRGFDSWFGLPYSNDMMPPWVKTAQPLRLHRDAKPLDESVDQDTLTERYTEDAVSFIQRAAADAERPFFLYLAHSMPHLPLHASARFRDQSRAGLYGDVIESLDWSTGAVLDALAQTGAADRTIVAFTSDNGPWSNMPPRMLQQGIERWHAGSSGLLRDAKATTYEGGIRVPAMIRWPGRVPEGRTVSDIATAMDLHVTLLRAAGLSEPGRPALDGDDLLPAMMRPESARPANMTTPREFYYFSNAALQGVRVGPWKLRRAEPGGEVELYNLELDPSERDNRAKAEPAIVERLDARLRAFAGSLESSRSKPAGQVR